MQRIVASFEIKKCVTIFGYEEISDTLWLGNIGKDTWIIVNEEDKELARGSAEKLQELLISALDKLKKESE
jgi:hypothetical protein